MKIAMLCAAALVCGGLVGCAASSNGERERSAASQATPLTIGESFTIQSAVLVEPRRLNVFVPSVYGQKLNEPLPVLYMLDGGLDEDFLHIAGLMQVLVSNQSMRPFVLVGIPNTNRRRDLTGPTMNAEDKKIAPVVGGSATFRRFIKDELMPEVRTRYRTTDEAALIGESLAGLFVVETFFLEPEMFQTYIAIDPSLWWADQELVKRAGERLEKLPVRGKVFFLANSDEPTIAKFTAQLAGVFEAHAGSGVKVRYAPMGGESHGTIYHPAAMEGMKAVLGKKEEK